MLPNQTRRVTRKVAARTETLNETDSSALWVGRFTNNGQQLGEKLMGQDKDQEGGIPTGLFEVGYRHNVLG